MPPSSSPDSQIDALGLVLPQVPKPVHVYKPIVISGNHVYISGHGPLQANGEYITGVVGRDLDLEAARAAARQCGLALLSTLRRELGSLDRIGRVIKMLGMVNSAPDFYDHPKVINACSELFAEVWGPDLGVGARSAVGMGPLPGNIAVEIEVIFELR
jgi:enamine deaminase RidA (YjgF/YER057c/UK114 family)